MELTELTELAGLTELTVAENTKFFVSVSLYVCLYFFLYVCEIWVPWAAYAVKNSCKTFLFLSTLKQLLTYCIPCQLFHLWIICNIWTYYFVLFLTWSEKVPVTTTLYKHDWYILQTRLELSVCPSVRLSVCPWISQFLSCLRS